MDSWGAYLWKVTRQGFEIEIEIEKEKQMLLIMSREYYSR